MEEIHWKRFFKGAGINNQSSHEYSLIFVKNKISDSILSQLNEGYLKSMGIVAIGDIIRILKHTKDFIDNKRIHPISIQETKERYVKLSTINFQETEDRSISNKLPITSTYHKPPGCELPVPIKRIVTPEIEGGYKIKYPDKARVVMLQQMPQEKKQSIITSNRTVLLNDTTQFTVHKNVSVLKRLGHSAETYSVSSSSENDESYSEKEINKKRKVEVMDNKTVYNKILKGNLSKDTNMNLLSTSSELVNKTSERNVFSRLGNSIKNGYLEIDLVDMDQCSPDSNDRINVQSSHKTESLMRSTATSSSDSNYQGSDSDSFRKSSTNIWSRLGKKL